MKLSTYENESSYVATIVKLPELKPVAGLDNLVVANIFWYNCLVSKNSDATILYVFFPAETVLSKTFLKENNLYRSVLLNSDTEKKWFFEESGRVKAVKFKGIVSSWFLIPVQSLSVISNQYASLKEWDTFHSIDWVDICRKYKRYEAPKRLSASERTSKRLERFDIVIPNQFRFHIDTPQFLRFISDFKEWDKVVITEKLHGTSAVFANTLTRKKLSMIERIAKKFGISVNEYQYYPLYSSRKVIKNSEAKDPRNITAYYWEDVWWIHAKQLESKIEKGITLYWEIVWYTQSWEYIQKWYHYGCKEKESKFYCYRITYTTPDGTVIEFTDSQIRQYCSLRDIEVVPIIYSHLFNVIDFEGLIKWIEIMCPLNDNKVPREGVVIRRDGQESYSAYKLKSQLFLTYETKMLDEWEIDTEESENI